MTVDVKVIHAFSHNNAGGNPAGVVFNAGRFTNDQKQLIAAKAGFPETAFVSPSLIADYKLEFFTPTRQIPHCGHATIATYAYLKSVGKIPGEHSSKETIDGIRSIRFKGTRAYMEQRAPTFTEPSSPRDEILQSLHISQDALLPKLEPAVVNTGNAFLVISVKDETALARIDYDRDAVYKISEQLGLIGYYLYTPANGLFDATTRMFAPLYGIDEEAGTGMAAGPLACYMNKIAKNKKEIFQIQQGLLMPKPSPSLIEVELEMEGSEIKGLFAGGSAYVSQTVMVEI
jgi:PhzF family phenazine biosynthesis protein